MRVILTRHYKTRSNEDGRIMGWGDSQPGGSWREDIDFVEGCLREQRLIFDCVHSSDLRRSRQTAIILARRFGVDSVISDASLNEINYGALQTLKKDAVAKTYPWHKKDPGMAYPDGESFNQMQRRSVAYLSSLTAAQSAQVVLLVAHAGVIRGLVSHYLGLDFAAQLARRVPFRYIGDFRMDGEACCRYDELGERSGFVEDGVIELPWRVAGEQP